VIALACAIGVLGGYGAVLFTLLIDFVTRYTVEPILRLGSQPGGGSWLLTLWIVPALGLFAVSWFTRRFAPEAQGHGVPEVITAVARHDGVIRPRVSVVKILASGVCIGTGGSIGREGPIVQIGSSLGSVAGQWFGLSPRHIKVLVAAGAAAGISATFNAPLAGVMFASEIILGSFAVESLTPIVISSVLANVVQQHSGEHGVNPAFPEVFHSFHGVWAQLPSYFLLGLLCGLAAVMFTKMLYYIEDVTGRRLSRWWLRALVLGALVGVVGVLYRPMAPPDPSPAAARCNEDPGRPLPPLFGVGYDAVAHALHLENAEKPSRFDVQELVAQHHVTVEELATRLDVPVENLTRMHNVTMRELATANGLTIDELAKILEVSPEQLAAFQNLAQRDHTVRLDANRMLAQLWWLLPLVFLKPVMTSLTLAGGGSGGIFAPSLFLGAMLGASFGLIINLLFPELSAHPGVYAIVGMGAVVAGTTHGTLSAILIVYEMTGDYWIILPIMIAAGMAGVVARFIDHESIYMKKLSRREESIARGHDVHGLEHIMVRDVMIRHFPTLHHTDGLTEIVRVARENLHIESLPVMNDEGQLIGIIRPGDLERVLDSELPPHLINAGDVAMMAPIALRTNDNLLAALRDFGACDVETLPVETGEGDSRRVVGLLLRNDVMGRYRKEMLRKR